MNGKNKGSSFERDISKKLSLWISEGKRDDLLWRSQSSGGRWTQRNKKGLKTENQVGDIASTNEESKWFVDKFIVECKSYKDINLWSIITKSKGTIIDWLDTILEQCEKEGKIPFLIVKENNKPILVITHSIEGSILYNSELRFDYKEEEIFVYKLENILKSSVKYFRDYCRI